MIKVSHLTKRYGDRAAIHDLSFAVNKGEVVGFLGPNGAGKSTTMKILTGFMPATEGTANIAGFDVFENAMDVKRNVGYLPETPPIYMEMKVQDYLEFAAKLHQMPSAQISRSVNTVLERTGLGDVRGRLIGNLSKGYRQRVGLAQALVHNPKVLILDEPTVGLDPKQIIEIRELIKGLAGDHTVILSSHILPEVTATCGRIIVINQGKIVAEDSIESLTSKMKHGSVFSLLVKNPIAAGIEALRNLSGIQKVSAAGPKITVELKSGAPEIREQILQIAAAQNMGVLEFSAEKQSLEEVFLQLTSIKTESIKT